MTQPSPIGHLLAKPRHELTAGQKRMIARRAVDDQRKREAAERLARMTLAFTVNEKAQRAGLLRGKQ